MEVEGREQREWCHLGQCSAALWSQRLGGPRVCYLGACPAPPSEKQCRECPLIRADQTGLGPAVGLAHHFPSLNHRAVARIQGENSGECLETAEEGGGLALGTVHCGAGQLFTPGTVRHWFTTDLLRGGQAPERGGQGSGKWVSQGGRL